MAKQKHIQQRSIYTKFIAGEVTLQLGGTSGLRNTGIHGNVIGVLFVYLCSSCCCLITKQCEAEPGGCSPLERGQMARAATKIAADGFVIRRLSDSIGYDPLTEEWHFRARKSSSSSSGSNRHSWDDEREAFEESLKARRATLVVTGGLEVSE